MVKLEIQQQIISLEYRKYNNMSQRNETLERSPFSPCASETWYTTMDEIDRYQTVSTAAETSSLNLPPSTFKNISFPCEASVTHSQSYYQTLTFKHFLRYIFCYVMFFLCFFLYTFFLSKVRNIPERVIQISTTGLRDNTNI